MTRDEATDFVRRLVRRNPALAGRYAALLGPQARLDTGLEALGAGFEDMSQAADLEGVLAHADMAALETIVREERPVFFALPPRGGAPASFDIADAALHGPEALRLRDDLSDARARIEPLLPRIGRIDILGSTVMPFVGTGWIIDDGIVVTNRHVAELVARGSGTGFVFRTGGDGRPLSVLFDPGHFRDMPAGGAALKVDSVLYIEPTPAIDIAFLRLAPSVATGTLAPLPIAEEAADPDKPLCAIGYPARASTSVIPDQALMRQLYRDVYDVKRLAPGYVIAENPALLTHDCTTLGGCSGCCVVSMATGKVVGLHFAGIYRQENQAVPARILADYRSRRRWLRPPEVEAAASLPEAQPPPSAPSSSRTVIITNTPTPGSDIPADAATRARPGIEAAVAAFLDSHGRQGVMAGRAGFLDEPGRIGDTPCIAISLHPAAMQAAQAGLPAIFQGYPVRYEAATIGEQLEADAAPEAVGGIAYDDEARTGADYRLDEVTEAMEIRAHVSPEYGFEELKTFLNASWGRTLVSAMYEFKGSAIAELIGTALEKNASLALALDNVTLPRAGPLKKASAEQDASPLEFETRPRFDAWRAAYGRRFDYVVVPEGRQGLIMMAYHIKVTVRDDDWLWLSSGNWKNTSSQPVVSEAQREQAAAGTSDLPGNRDWHVVMKSPTLAWRFRSHIAQDIVRSRQLIAGHEEAPSADLMVLLPDVPPEPVAERRPPPAHLLAPRVVKGAVTAAPLLTPDRGGRVYTEAVLALIRSARHSLWFQIPYIGMRRDPRVHRGNIDELIDALVEKLRNLDDARVLLRTGNRDFSDNRHVAWYFKSHGVDIENRLRAIDNHHTKGMVVDGERVLIGSHNWSSQGVSVNRDASIIFANQDLAAYYGEALDIDWQRASAVRPAAFTGSRPQLVPASQGLAESPGYRAVTLAEYLAEMED